MFIFHSACWHGALQMHIVIQFLCSKSFQINLIFLKLGHPVQSRLEVL